MFGKVEIVTNSQLKKYLLRREASYIEMMRVDAGEPLSIACEDNCYSMSIIMAYELMTKAKGVLEVFTMEGRGEGLTPTNGHEVLGTRLKDGFSYADGTIWQWDAMATQMRINGPFGVLAEMIAELQTYYGGNWRQKEIPTFFLTSKAVREKQRLLSLKKEWHYR